MTLARLRIQEVTLLDDGQYRIRFARQPTPKEMAEWTRHANDDPIELAREVASLAKMLREGMDPLEAALWAERIAQAAGRGMR